MNESQYTLKELKEMPTLNEKETDEYYNHPYGELKVYTDKQRVWLGSDNVVLVEEYVSGFGWEVEEEYTAE